MGAAWWVSIVLLVVLVGALGGSIGGAAENGDWTGPLPAPHESVIRASGATQGISSAADSGGAPSHVASRMCPTASRIDRCAFGAGTASYQPWSNLSTSLGPGPPCLSDSSAAYDEADGYTVVFGGAFGCGPSAGTTSNQTWALDLGGWVNKTSTSVSSPSPRSGASLAYDPELSGLLLFGGRDASGHPLNDTWAYRSGNWSNLTPAVSPPARDGAGLAYDTLTHRAVVFGGASSSGLDNDTWSYHAGQWEDLKLSTAPSPRTGAGLVADPPVKGLLLFGGSGGGAVGYNDTWVLGASGWNSVGTRSSPDPSSSSAIAYDPPLGGVVLFGGCADNPCTQVDGGTWAFVDAAWWNLTTVATPSPPPRGEATLAFDSGQGELILFGGIGGTRGDDTWALSLPLLGWVEPSSPVTDEGRGVTMGLLTAGGIGPFGVSWIGLPPGCATAMLAGGSCDPNTTGAFSIGGWVVDSAGEIGPAIPSLLTVNPPLLVALTATSLVGGAPLKLNLSATPLNGTPPYTLSWVDTGSTTLTQSVGSLSVRYDDPGTYLVDVTAQDAVGGSASTVLAIQVFLPLTSTFSVSLLDQGCSQGQPIDRYVLVGSSSGGEAPYAYRWTVGGQNHTGSQVWANLSAGSPLPVNLTTTDAVRDSSSNTSSVRTQSFACSAGTNPLLAPTVPLWALGALLALVLFAGLAIPRVWSRRPAGAVSENAPEGGVPLDSEASPPTEAQTELAEAPVATGAVTASDQTREGPVGSEKGPPKTAGEPGTGPLSDQILRALARHAPLHPDEVAPAGMTQSGLAESLGKVQGSFARVLQRLEAAGVVTSDLRHVRGATRRQKVYELTPRGRELARIASRARAPDGSGGSTSSSTSENAANLRRET
ncbi:MAG: PKD domain-containing protein [Candidatus Lutacidiplasmatales archaeon]